MTRPRRRRRLGTRAANAAPPLNAADCSPQQRHDCLSHPPSAAIACFPRYVLSAVSGSILTKSLSLLSRDNLDFMLDQQQYGFPRLPPPAMEVDSSGLVEKARAQMAALGSRLPGLPGLPGGLAPDAAAQLYALGARGPPAPLPLTAQLWSQWSALHGVGFPLGVFGGGQLLPGLGGLPPSSVPMGVSGGQRSAPAPLQVNPSRYSPYSVPGKRAPSPPSPPPRTIV